MTKAAALLLAGSLALAACASDEKAHGGGSGGGAGASEDLKIGLAYDTGGRGDRSFNDSAYAGVEAAIEELGGEVQEVSPNDDGSNRAELLSNLAEQGYNPVIAVGFAYDEVIGEVARVPGHDVRAGRRLERGRRQGWTTSPACSSPSTRARSSPVSRPRSRPRPARSASSAASTPS